MHITLPRVLYTATLVLLTCGLVLVIWQPVLPSGLIIEGMANQMDARGLALEKPVVLRFELAGRGGGDYNLVMTPEKVEMTEGETNQVDLLIAMKATDFNALVLQMAQGRADESLFAKLMVSNVLKMAGDMSVLALLNPTGEGNNE
ncbi:MAG: hypothetical protein R3228_08140 [Halioglobus sp.]|nr:hypothetical protein [Halioglobus sp.]